MADTTPKELKHGAAAPRLAKRGNRGVRAPVVTRRRTATSPTMPAAERPECQPVPTRHRPHPAAPPTTPAISQMRPERPVARATPTAAPAATASDDDDDPEPATDPSHHLREIPNKLDKVPEPSDPPPPPTPAAAIQPETLARGGSATAPNYTSLKADRTPKYVHPPRRGGSTARPARDPNDTTPQYVQGPSGAPMPSPAAARAPAPSQGAGAHRAVRGLQVQINHRPKPQASTADTTQPMRVSGRPGAVRSVQDLQAAAAEGDSEAQALLRQLNPDEMEAPKG